MALELSDIILASSLRIDDNLLRTILKRSRSRQFFAVVLDNECQLLPLYLEFLHVLLDGFPQRRPYFLGTCKNNELLFVSRIRDSFTAMNEGVLVVSYGEYIERGIRAWR